MTLRLALPLTPKMLAGMSLENLTTLRQSIAKRIGVQTALHLVDHRVSLDEPPSDAVDRVFEHHHEAMMRLTQSLNVVKAQIDDVNAITPIHEHPRDDKPVLLYHTIHGWVQGRYAKGEWSEHHEYGREYDGPVWVLGDDLEQAEVEEVIGQDGLVEYHDGRVTHYKPLPPVPEGLASA